MFILANLNNKSHTKSTTPLVYYETPLDVWGLNGTNGFKMTSNMRNSFGYSVCSAGDVNGDGFDDLIIGAYGEASNAGASYVIFGQKETFPSIFNVANLNGFNGFKITGNSFSFGNFVSGAGDVNTDGFDDMVIGAVGENNNAGASYVVFGKANGFASVLNVSTLNGTNGFKITPNIAAGSFGNSVSGAGDVNADGFDDMVIGAVGENSSTGASYVVFGKANGFASVLNVSTLNGTNGFKITPNIAAGSFGNSVSDAGDVNADGFDDMVIGARNERSGDDGASYVIFGQKENGFSGIFDISTLNGTNGFKMTGNTMYGYFGDYVSGAGDVNADGFDDLIIGEANYLGNPYASYVVFGKASGFASIFDISILNGNNGFKITDIMGGIFGNSVSGGDINGDNYADLIIGARSESASYIVYGSIGNIISPSIRSNINLANFSNSDGFVIKGAATGDYAGTSVSGAGDINKDGIPDLLIGAPWANANVAGGAYVVYGGQNGTIYLETLSSSQGFSIQGDISSDLTGTSVSGIGDVNGDGIMDLMIGAPAANDEIGQVYVVYGGQNSTIQLSSFPSSQGFIIRGSSAERTTGISVSGTGDVNQDGIPDLLMGTKVSNDNFNAAYLVYGGQNGTIYLETFPSIQGFVMQGEIFVTQGDNSNNCSVSGTADIDGDGIPDMLLKLDPISDYVSPGNAYLVYGGQKGKINLNDFPNTQGFVITGALSNSYTGQSVSGTGDFNGDGIPDLLIGAPGNSAPENAYLVYGGQDGTINLASFSNSQGLVIIGAGSISDGYTTGQSVSGTGDVNGDGIPDLLIGAPGIEDNTGMAYVVYGGRSGIITLADFPNSCGFAIKGVAVGDRFGASVSGTGDVNQDGIPDLLIGAPGANRNAGAAYVIYGQKQTTTASPIHNEQESSTDILCSMREHFNHFYQQGKEYLSSFWINAAENTIEPELSAKEQARLRELFKMQVTIENLIRNLDSTNKNEEFLKKALAFYLKKITQWQETVRELNAQDIRDLQEDVMKLRWNFYDLDNIVSTETLTQSRIRAEIGFFRSVNTNSTMEPMMLAAQANHMLP